MRCASSFEHLVHARRDVDRLEDFLLLVRLDVHVGDGKVGERRRLVDRLDRAQQIGRRLRKQLHRFERLRLQIDEARLDFRRTGFGFGNPQHARDEERPAAEIFDDLETLLALADEMVRAVRRSDVAHDVGERAHAMHVDGRGICNLGIALQQDADLPLIAHRLLGGGNRLRPAERDRQHQTGKQHRIAHRHDDQRIGRYRRQARSGAFAGSVLCHDFHFSHGSPPFFAR